MKKTCFKNLQENEQVIGKALGFRAWNFSPKANDLKSLFLYCSWRPGTNHSYCFNRSCFPPEQECMCGFHAWNRYNYSRFYSPNIYLIQGAIAGWGKMQIHAHGWRSEKSEILALKIPRPFVLSSTYSREAIEKLSDFYQVPVFQSATLMNLYIKRLSKREKLIRL